jgi:hypothetical protein
MKLQAYTDSKGWLYVESLRDTPNELSLLCSKDEEDGINADYLQIVSAKFPSMRFREVAQTVSI